MLLFVSASCGPERPADEAPLVVPPTSPVPIRAASGEAPGFALPTLYGDTLRLQAYRGHVVVLAFWAPWCTPCRVQAPELVALHEALGGANVRIASIALDAPEADVRSFAEEFGLPYPIALGDEATAEAYGGLYSLPTTVLIDRGGTLRARLIGRAGREQLEPLVRALLSEARPEAH